MPVLRVGQSDQRRAFEIIEGAPDYQTRHGATAVYVRYLGLRAEGRIRTYANDALHLLINHDYHFDFTVLPNGSLLYELAQI